MTIRPPITPPPDGRPANACEDALQDAFLDIATRASDAGWPRDEVARALLRLAGAYSLEADAEHDPEVAMTVVRKTVQ